MSDPNQTFVKDCRTIARSLRLEACKSLDGCVILRLQRRHVEVLASMLDGAGDAAATVDRFKREMRGLEASRAYWRACASANDSERMACVVLGGLAVCVDEWLRPVFAALLS